MTHEQIEAIRQRAKGIGVVVSSEVFDEYHGFREYTTNCEGAKFIAHAREDIPALLAEVERLKSELDELIGSVYDHCNAFSEPFCIAERFDEERR